MITLGKKIKIQVFEETLELYIQSVIHLVELTQRLSESKVEKPKQHCIVKYFIFI